MSKLIVGILITVGMTTITYFFLGAMLAGAVAVGGTFGIIKKHAGW